MIIDLCKFMIMFFKISKKSETKKVTETFIDKSDTKFYFALKPSKFLSSHYQNKNV